MSRRRKKQREDRIERLQTRIYTELCEQTYDAERASLTRIVFGVIDVGGYQLSSLWYRRDSASWTQYRSDLAVICREQLNCSLDAFIAHNGHTRRFDEIVDALVSNKKFLLLGVHYAEQLDTLLTFYYPLYSCDSEVYGISDDDLRAAKEVLQSLLVAQRIMAHIYLRGQ